MGWDEQKHSVWAQSWRHNDKSTPTFFFLRSYLRHVHCLCYWIFPFFFFFLDELEILFKEKTNYTGKQASPWIIETKVRGLLPTSKEPKNLKAKDYFVREWGAILHNLGTQQTETLEEDAKRIQESSQMDLILRARGGVGGGGELPDQKGDWNKLEYS